MPGRASVKGKRLTIRFYKRFSDIASQTRDRIQRRLGYKRGPMRRLASKHDPECVVAFADSKVIGWVALFRPGQCDEVVKKKYRSMKHKAVQIFVQKKFRRLGVGERMMNRLCERKNLHDGERIIRFEPNKKAGRFFKAVGFEK